MQPSLEMLEVHRDCTFPDSERRAELACQCTTHTRCPLGTGSSTQTQQPPEQGWLPGQCSAWNCSLLKAARPLPRELHVGSAQVWEAEL